MKSIILHDFEVRNALKNDVIQIRRPTKIIYECAIGDTKIEPKFQDTLMAKWILKTLKCPFGQPGDRLWVKETWQAVSPDENYRIIEECNIIYAATDIHPGFLASEYRYHNGYKNDDGADVIYPWESSIHMPLWASRITLEVEDIRVELVQDITEDDAKAEGIDPEFEMSVEEFYNKKISPNSTYKLGFKHVWDSLYAKKGFGWDNSLPVWVGKFKIVERK
jgi:hypothetical protein